MSNGQVLLLIAAFLSLTIGSFIYYIATWEDRTQSSLIILPKTLSPEAPVLSKGTYL